jgi:hypothetical protein
MPKKLKLSSPRAASSWIFGRAKRNLSTWQLPGVFLPGFVLGSLGYGAAVEIRSAQDYDDYRLVAPFRGRLSAVIRRTVGRGRLPLARAVSPQAGS